MENSFFDTIYQQYTKIVYNRSSTKDVRTYLFIFNPPLSSYPRLSAFCLTTPLPQSVWTLSWKTIKELQKIGKNKSSSKKIRILYLIRVCLFIFQPLTKEYDDKIMFKCSLFSYRNCSEKDVNLKLTPLPPKV